ncbi:hypothetical protein [Burkholderia sp. Ac-20353]|uniref:hypothetical protein n=1 Tax=Burkholderia sp. Ac-20353 TaxID=2703894 RepID=UPI00197B36F1|nr:hypothetical protein [Burkholderia sp. Ac-20353]MBN3790869.1 hypothetical protein [Burkholderia sp. Ac-20353]
MSARNAILARLRAAAPGVDASAARTVDAPRIGDNIGDNIDNRIDNHYATRRGTAPDRKSGV